jgi:hypothetical protein
VKSRLFKFTKFRISESDGFLKVQPDHCAHRLLVNLKGQYISKREYQFETSKVFLVCLVLLVVKMFGGLAHASSTPHS